jgi:hypothetical protein
MKQIKADSIKSQIIIACLDYLETNEDMHKSKAIDLLKELASHYNVFLNKQSKSDLKQSLRRFILNNEGYNTTLRALYFSL